MFCTGKDVAFVVNCNMTGVQKNTAIQRNTLAAQVAKLSYARAEKSVSKKNPASGGLSLFFCFSVAVAIGAVNEAGAAFICGSITMRCKNAGSTCPPSAAGANTVV